MQAADNPRDPLAMDGSGDHEICLQTNSTGSWFQGSHVKMCVARAAARFGICAAFSLTLHSHLRRSQVSRPGRRQRET
jgi:hypothetical protein